jgi:hypothetical protein
MNDGAIKSLHHAAGIDPRTAAETFQEEYYRLDDYACGQRAGALVVCSVGGGLLVAAGLLALVLA